METSERIETGYRRERAPLLAWLGSRLGAEAAEDALHDIVARSLANIDSMEPLRDVGAWLWRAARNAVIDAWRSRARKAEAGEVDPWGAEADRFDDFIDGALRSAHDEAERAETLEALYAAIDGLPAAQRSVIVAQAIRGETFASISRRTGVAIETLAARKRYALARLRMTLAEYE